MVGQPATDNCDQWEPAYPIFTCKEKNMVGQLATDNWDKQERADPIFTRKERNMVGQSAADEWDKWERADSKSMLYCESESLTRIHSQDYLKPSNCWQAKVVTYTYDTYKGAKC